jgi:hypothetical protein
MMLCEVDQWEQDIADLITIDLGDERIIPIT